jgi:hypothetical protein
MFRKIGDKNELEPFLSTSLVFSCPHLEQFESSLLLLSCPVLSPLLSSHSLLTCCSLSSPFLYSLCRSNSFMMTVKSGYLIKHILLIICILVDISINSSVDQSNDQISLIGLTIAQCIIRLCSLFLLFIFMSSTFVFKYGLLGVLCARFRLVFLSFLISLAFTLSLRVSRILDIDNSSSLWSNSYYIPIYVLHNLLSCVYYMSLLQAAFDLANPNLFKPNEWINH